MEYYEDYIQEVKEVCKNKNYKITKIGVIGKKKEFPMYKIIINQKSPKRTICFSAGIHGEEIAGPWAVLKFLQIFDSKKFKNLKIIIFPVASPSAFYKQKRYDFLNRELNGHFCDKRLSGEDRFLFNALKGEKIFFFHAIHEDIDEKFFYLYNFEKKKEKIYRDIIKLAEKFFGIDKRKKISGSISIGGLVTNEKDGSFEDRMYRDGTPYSMCSETPIKNQSLDKRIRLNVEIMKKVIKFSNHF